MKQKGATNVYIYQHTAHLDYQAYIQANEYKKDINKHIDNIKMNNSIIFNQGLNTKQKGCTILGYNDTWICFSPLFFNGILEGVDVGIEGLFL